MKLTLKRYAVILGFALAGGVIIALLRDTFKMQGAALVGNLSDSFTIPGAILVAVGGLLWVAGDGFFDMLTYGLKNGLHTLLPFYKLERKSFYAPDKNVGFNVNSSLVILSDKFSAT